MLNGTLHAVTEYMNETTILIVDDEPQFRFSLTLTLMHHGYHVLEGANGLEALQILSENSESVRKIDVLVTDIKMPGMDGLELIRCIRQGSGPFTSSFTGPFKILVMTGFGDRETLSLLQELGVCGVIHKPFSGEQVIDAIRSALANVPQVEGINHNNDMK